MLHPRRMALILSIACRFVAFPALAASLTVTATAGHAQTNPPSTLPTSCTMSTSSSQGNCLVGVSPSLGVASIGVQKTFTFVCDAGIVSSGLYGPGGTAAAPTLAPGCYNVVATVTNLTAGGYGPITSGTCGTSPGSPFGGNMGCGANGPICPVGTTSAGGTAANPCPTTAGPPSQLQCPSGFTYTSYLAACIAPMPSPTVPTYLACYRLGGRTMGTLCFVYPTSTGGGGAGTTLANTASVVTSPGAPDDYLITYTGYVPTTSSGACPSGTTYVSSVVLNGRAGPLPAGPACQFSVTAELKVITITSIQISLVPQGEVCGGIIVAGRPSFMSPCEMTANAFGSVVLATGVNCFNYPPYRYVAPPADLAALGPTVQYSCTNGSLSVVGIPINANVTYSLTGPGMFLRPGFALQCGFLGGTSTITTTTGTVVGVCPTGPGTVSVMACLAPPLLNPQPMICSSMFDP